MKLTSNDRYLSLLLQTLETRIMPDLSTPAVKEIAGTMQAGLLELLRRSRRTAPILHEALAEGELIVAQMTTLMRRREVELPAVQACTLSRELVGSNDAAEAHAALTDYLTVLSDALSKSRRGRDDAEVATLLRQVAEWELRWHKALLAPEVGDRDDNPIDVAPLPHTVLEAFLQLHHADGAKARLVTMERATVGLGKQTFLIEVADANGKLQSLVVRKMDGAPLTDFKAFNVAQEFALLQDVAPTGFPAPTPMWLGKNITGSDGDFYVMNRLPGKVMGTWINAGEKLPESQLLHIAELMAKLHTIDIDRFAAYIRSFESDDLLHGNNEACYRRAIQDWRDYGTSQGQLASPSMIFATDWLAANMPADTRRPVLVHGDFNIHNLLAEGDRISGVLDWECAMFGAPEQDLAWARPNIEKHMPFARFVEHYHASGGQPVHEEWLDYYHAFSSMRQIAIIGRGLCNIQEGRSGDIRHTLLQSLFLPEVLKQTLGSCR